MSTMAGISVYTFPPSPPKWDGVGVFYVSFCAIWSTLVFSGMAFCWFNRHNPILKIRGLPLSFAAITFLHTYWILGQITYPIGGTMPLVLAYDIQYFFMGIWFPLGIALFHASNIRFLHVAKLQKQFTHPDLRSHAGCNGAQTSWLCRLRNMNYSEIVMILIGLGMVLQALLTVAIGGSRSRVGMVAVGTMASDLDLDRRTDPDLASLGNPRYNGMAHPDHRLLLHATPMFMISTYVPAFAPVNAYFAPSQWIHLSVMMFEVFTVFVPVCQVLMLWILNKKVVDSNAKWETASQATTLRVSASAEWNSSLSVAEKGQPLDYLDQAMGDRLLTMSALDHVLNENPGPLQDFSALSDFSGENIAFLTRTAFWRSMWPAPGEQQKLDAYNHALEIYTDFISPRDAEFPLNLSSQDLKRLEDIFEKSARITGIQYTKV
ncbi:hypothetical protein G7Z17_g7018 [Cylindrodendrum hubeiense]|uniref:RGS domain-containing protein n=1 Tax=Cylindrodendrum hubeiense TaxID=595255 RepID=A0A9P5H4E1_9HYPO|nr:hypothetical protein G7Z17_g7018 [Cylindrodendrum hubeiense]